MLEQSASHARPSPDKADRHWKEVMDMAERYGFIAQSYAGTALLLTHQVQLESYGERGYLQIQKMNGHCPKDMGYKGCLTEDGLLQDCVRCDTERNGAKWIGFERNAAAPMNGGGRTEQHCSNYSEEDMT